MSMDAEKDARSTEESAGPEAVAPKGEAVARSGRDAQGRFTKTRAKAAGERSGAARRERKTKREANGEGQAVHSPKASAGANLSEADVSTLGLDVLRDLALDPHTPAQTRAYAAKALSDTRVVKVRIPTVVAQLQGMSDSDLWALAADLDLAVPWVVDRPSEGAGEAEPEGDDDLSARTAPEPSA
jgi:hypothetical protein